LAKEQLSPEELNKFLLDQDNRRIYAWHVAAERGKVEIAKVDKGNAVLYHKSFRGNAHFSERYRSGRQNK
jgi:hypothetical protein